MRSISPSEKKAVACPKCKNDNTDRIPRSSLVKTFLPWSKLRHFVCYRCGNRFYAKVQ